MNDDFEWPVANPFIEARDVVAGDIDAFKHVNNLRYIEWAMDVAWRHSHALGLSFTDYQRLGVGCVIQRHSFEYLAPALIDERIAIATWIGANDGRVRLTRNYDIRHSKTGAPLFRGETHFVCISLETGKPTRMPQDFVEAYRPAEKIRE